MPPELRSRAEATPASAGDLPDAWEAAIERFDAAWRTGSPPRIEAYLPTDAAPADLLPSLLAELIVIDLEYRWRTAPTDAGALPAQPLLEDYQAAFPALASGGRLSLHLIGEEYRIRQRWGDRPSRDSYARRFALGQADAKALFDRIDAQVQLEAPLPTATPISLAPSEERSVGPYQLLEQIGQGWSSHVFRARHTKLDRVVALKVLRKELVAELGPEVIHRFFHEMQAVGRINHPNVVHAFDAGAAGVTYYLALEYVRGVDLDRLVKESGPLPINQALAYANQVVEGLRHIHQQGLVHRDLKPSNLLLEQKEEGIGRVKILDLGFALLRRTAGVQSATGLTSAGDIIGSTDYLAPEQAMDAHRTDHRADLYSLGCTLYFLLTGQPPFSRGTFAQKLIRHQSETPIPLNEIRPEVSGNLARIVSRLLAKQPEERFQTTAEVATALAGTLPSPRRTWPRWRLAGAALLVFCLLLSLIWLRSSPHPAIRETAPRLVHESARQRPPGASVPLDEAAATPLTPTEPLPAQLWPGNEMGHIKAAWAVAFAPDGLSLASAAEDGIMVWDCRTGRERFHYDLHHGCVRSLAYSGDGSLIASGGFDDGMVRLWHPESGKQMHVLQAAGRMIHSVAFSSDGKEVAAGCHLVGSICRWNVATGQSLPTLTGHPWGTWAVAYGNDPTQLASGGLNGTATLWDLATSKPLHDLPGHQGGTIGMAWRPGTSEIATCGSDHTVSIWKVKEPHPRVLRGHAGRVRCVAYRPDGGLLASGAEDQTVRLWRPDTGELIRELPMGPGGHVTGVAFSPEGRHLAVALLSGVVLVLRLEAPGR